MLTVAELIKIVPFRNPTIHYWYMCGYRREESSVCFTWSWRHLIC